MIKAGIIGGAGHRAGELIRLLINHPDVELMWINNPDECGKSVSEVHHGLTGETPMKFSSEIDLENVDVVFSCLPKGRTSALLESVTLPEKLKFIDLSGDFRTASETSDFVYGLSELNRKPMVRGALHVATPGSVAMAVELALLPLAKNLMLNSPIHITAITGTTDTETAPESVIDFEYRHDNISLSRAFVHPQLDEICTTLRSLQSSFNAPLNLLSFGGSFPRGTLVAAYLDTPIELSQIHKLYEEYFDDHNFTFVVDRQVDIKDVANTNKCLIHLEKIDGKLLITAAIDNLLKGASGNAVHCMNLLFGLHERVGLMLKGSAY